MILFLLKAGCLAIYAMALAGLAGFLPNSLPAPLPIPLPAQLAGTLRNIVLAMLAIHALEAYFMRRHLRLYRGSLAASIALTMLFGALHWKPLADARAKTARGNT